MPTRRTASQNGLLPSLKRASGGPRLKTCWDAAEQHTLARCQPHPRFCIGWTDGLEPGTIPLGEEEETVVAGDIRYMIKGDNSVLRSVLHRIWGYKCYWCGTPKDLNEVQIDHIVPQTATSGRLHRLAMQFNLPDGFDVHDPYNLAPICSSCNGQLARAARTGVTVR